MKTIDYTYQIETIEAADILTRGTISHQSHCLGLSRAEPIIVIMDSLLRYAKAHKARFESTMAEDYVLGPQWLEAIKAVRALCNGDGAIAHELGRTTDTKDNGCVETVFWVALEVAGYTEETANL